MDVPRDILFKIYNYNNQKSDWIDLIVQDKSDFVQIIDCSKIKGGENILMNRLKINNNKIEHDWLNLFFESFKIKCKIALDMKIIISLM